MVKFKTALLEVPEFVTDAAEPGGPVMVEPTVIETLPCVLSQQHC